MTQLNKIVIARLVKFYNEHKIYYVKKVDDGIFVETLILL
jgi:hypothetical protein